MTIEELKQSILDLIAGTTNYELIEIIYRLAKKLLG